MRGQFLPQLAVNKEKGTGPEEKLLPWLMLLQLLGCWYCTKRGEEGEATKAREKQ